MQDLPNQLIKHKKPYKNEWKTDRRLLAKSTQVKLNTIEVKNCWRGITIKNWQDKRVLNLNSELKKGAWNNERKGANICSDKGQQALATG